MPSKRQRRRREKTFRHEYGFVDYDEEGNEIEVDMGAVRAEKKPEKAKAAAPAKGGKGAKGAKGGKRSSRALRPAPEPSWNRSFKKGGAWGAGMLVLSVFFFKGMPLPSRIILGLLYGVAFIPLTYWIDRTAYRSYLKRTGKTPTSS